MARVEPSGCPCADSAAGYDQAIFYTVKNPHQQARELDGFGCFGQVAVVEFAVTGGIAENCHRAGEQKVRSLLLPRDG